ncbi:hypothetical protein [Marinobacter salexigens]|uniref:HzsA-related protein n=1 Tax=Marinobacter salexigens TaxID=1925763 RepID=UPI0013747FBF|nr:hypothetical protein [Marinobacter salexigens]
MAQKSTKIISLLACLGLLAVLSGCLPSADSQRVDPVVVENPVVFVKRPLLFDTNSGALIEDNLADPSGFRPGARLFVKASASIDARAIDVSSRAFTGPEFLDDAGRLLYDVKDLHVSHDGNRALFAMRAPEIEGADEEDQPTWNIWEYDHAANLLRRVLTSDQAARRGQDVAPAYLPDGRIVFSSTRQRTSKAILLDENKGQFAGLDENRNVPAFVLHTMDDDGENIQQITFNQSHDLDPLVTDEGFIVFSRWDNAGQTRNNGVNLYRVNPDGTGLSYLYGRHSHDSVPGTRNVQYLKARKTDSNSVLVQLRPFETNDYASAPAEVDVHNYVEAVLRIDGVASDGGQRPLIPGIRLDGELSLKGRYGSVSPLMDGTHRYLVSWTPCRLSERASGRIVNCTEERLESDAYVPAPPVYGLWLLDVANGTQRPVVEPSEGEQFDEAMLMRERPLEGFIPDAQPMGDAAQLAEDGYGILHIRSVYDIDGVDRSPNGIATTANPLLTNAEQRPARFLRLEKPVSMPDDNVKDFDNSAFGRSRGQLMREILGYVPIEPDGSVKVAVPANVAFAISVLDAQGRRTSDRHQNWLSVRPGETMGCQGCHDPRSPASHGRPDAGPAPVWGGASTTSLPFPGTDPTLYADMGETMAEVYARTQEIRRPLPDPVYRDDEWADLASSVEDRSLAYENLQTPPPVSGACANADEGAWTANCRVVINYETHIHPLWDSNREVVDGGGAVLDDHTCTSCHTNSDNAESPVVAAADLDLTNGPSDANPSHFKSYRELLFPDNKQELNPEGVLVDEMVDSGEVLRDEEGEPILDEDGFEQPIFIPVPVPASMSVNGALASTRFQEVFRSGGTHSGRLSPAELRLIAEWLDMGAQYYNNPFDAPDN